MWKILGKDFGSFFSIKCSFHWDLFFFLVSISVLLINWNSDNLVTFLFYFFILLYDFAIFCFQLSFDSELSICTLLFKFGFRVCVFSYMYDFKIFSFVKFTFSPKSWLIINFYRFTCCGDNVYWLFGWICCIQSVI